MSEPNPKYKTKVKPMGILEILDRPIAYHRCFVTLTGSVKAAVMLSQAVYWQPRARQVDGWWYKTSEEWQEETGLSRHEQLKAREDCEKYLKSDLRGVPATLFWHVDEGALYEDLIGENVKTSFTKSGKLDVRKAANINMNTETTTENTHKTDEIRPENKARRTDAKVKGGMIDGMAFYAQQGLGQQVDKVEEILVALESGLHVNISRSTNNQQVAKRILKDGSPVEKWISWCKSDEWRLAHLYLYADLEKVWREWPQAFIVPAEPLNLVY